MWKRLASPYHIFRFPTKSVSLQCCKYFASFACLAFRILHHHKKEKPVPAIAHATHHLLMSFISTGCKLLARLGRLVFHKDSIRRGRNRKPFASRIFTRRRNQFRQSIGNGLFDNGCFQSGRGIAIVGVVTIIVKSFAGSRDRHARFLRSGPSR